MLKRIFLFVVTNILVLATITIAWQILNIFIPIDQMYQNSYYQYLIILCLLWGMGGAFISLQMSKFMAKTMMGVKIIDTSVADPKLRQVVDMVHRLSSRAGLPTKPEVGIYDSPEVNAFATGPSKRRSLVAVSTGLLNHMNDDQVEAIIGHEISHIANGDMVTMTLIQGVINAFVMFFARIVTNIIASQLDEDMGFFTELALVIFFQIIFGILGAVVVNYFSRLREFRADAGGARLVGKAKMISALKALAGTENLISKRGEALSSLKISGKTRRNKLTALLSTHPSLEIRINRLQKQ